MMKHVLALTVLLSSGIAQASEGAHWGYSGEGAPENWGKLSPEYSTCASGKNQSPIDLSNLIEARLKPIRFQYQAGAKEIINNGHTVQVNFAPGSNIFLDDHGYELKQIHFHAPSENQINGKSFPMEGHLVHADKEGHLAVIGVMFTEGIANPTIAQAWKQMPEQPGVKNAVSAPLLTQATGLLPALRDYYQFGGSLTTPPCTEGVTWLVMKRPVRVSKAQLQQFAKVMRHPNNRPVQPVNNRPVLK